MSVGVHPAVIEIVRELHGKSGVWTEEQQAAWLVAFRATVQYAYPAQPVPQLDTQR